MSVYIAFDIIISSGSASIACLNWDISGVEIVASLDSGLKAMFTYPGKCLTVVKIPASFWPKIKD